jgi:hypothetical protein
LQAKPEFPALLIIEAGLPKSISKTLNETVSLSNLKLHTAMLCHCTHPLSALHNQKRELKPGGVHHIGVCDSHAPFRVLVYKDA